MALPIWGNPLGILAKDPGTFHMLGFGSDSGDLSGSFLHHEPAGANPLLPGLHALARHIAAKNAAANKIKLSTKLDAQRPVHPPSDSATTPQSKPSATVSVPKKKLSVPPGGGGAGGGSTTPAASTDPAPDSDFQKALLTYLNQPFPKYLAGEAASQAQGQVAAQVGAVQTQQQQLINQGKQNAMAILAASRAGADLMKNLPQQTQDTYGQASRDIGALAGGYTGDLRNVLQGNANDVQSKIAGIGGGATPATAGGVNVSTLPQGVGNAAYAPADLHAGNLAAQGATAADAARLLPLQLTGAGSQGALLAQGAGNTAANNLYGQILNAKAQLGRLTQSDLAALTSAFESHRANDLKALALSGNLGLGFAKLNQQQTYQSGLLSHYNRQDATREKANLVSASKISSGTLSKMDSEAQRFAEGTKTRPQYVASLGKFVNAPEHQPLPFDQAVRLFATHWFSGDQAKAATYLATEPVYSKYLQGLAANAKAVQAYNALYKSRS